MLLQNTFEGGTDAATLTAGAGGNTGGASGNYFDEVAKHADGIVAFEASLALVGTRSLRLASRTAQSTYVGWTSAVRGTIADEFGGTYLQLGALPPSAITLIPFYSAATTTLAGSIQLLATGALRLVDNGGAASNVTSSALITAGTRFRLEWRYLPNNGTSSVFELRTYLGDSTTPLEAPITQAPTANVATSGRVRFGVVTAAANIPSASEFIHFEDHIVTGAPTWIGPNFVPPVIVAAPDFPVAAYAYYYGYYEDNN